MSQNERRVGIRIGNLHRSFQSGVIKSIFRIVKQDGIGSRHVQLLLVKAAIARRPDGAVGCIEPEATGITWFIVALIWLWKIVLPGMVGKG